LKEKQKTFEYFWHFTDDLICANTKIDQSFFASFFQKRSAFCSLINLNGCAWG
jgi:hypothetical protein